MNLRFVLQVTVFLCFVCGGFNSRANVLGFPDRHAETLSSNLVGTYEFQNPSTGEKVTATLRRERDHLTFLYVQGESVRGNFFPLESSSFERSVDSDGFTHYATDVKLDRSNLRAVVQKENEIRKFEESLSLSLHDGHLTVIVTRELFQRSLGASEWRPARTAHPDGLYTKGMSMGLVKVSDDPMSVRDLEVIAGKNAPPVTEPAQVRPEARSTEIDPSRPLAPVFQLGAARSRCAALFTGE